MQKTFHIYFEGAVQGVGFRFTAQDLAKRHRIKGWVMNLPNGGVELTAQGEADKVNDFLAGLKEKFKGYITALKSEELPSGVEYKDFQVKFSR